MWLKLSNLVTTQHYQQKCFRKFQTFVIEKVIPWIRFTIIRNKSQNMRKYFWICLEYLSQTETHRRTSMQWQPLSSLCCEILLFCKLLKNYFCSVSPESFLCVVVCDASACLVLWLLRHPVQRHPLQRAHLKWPHCQLKTGLGPGCLPHWCSSF